MGVPSRRIGVIVAGAALDPWATSSRPEFDEVVAVDGGLDVALAAGLRPSMLIGDLDSITSSGLAWVAAHAVPFQQHPVDKDDTDTALALDWLAHSGRLDGADLVLLAAGRSTRIDHVLGTLGALGAESLRAARTVTAHLGDAEVLVLHPHTSRRLEIGSGRTVSLLALHGDCHGVHVSGTKWELRDATLRAASTRGISNESIDDVLVIEVGDGVLTVVVPGDELELVA